jgi:hypothetical protein
MKNIVSKRDVKAIEPSRTLEVWANQGQGQVLVLKLDSRLDGSWRVKIDGEWLSGSNLKL